jgi:hypothetical protein
VAFPTVHLGPAPLKERGLLLLLCALFFFSLAHFFELTLLFNDQDFIARLEDINSCNPPGAVEVANVFRELEGLLNVLPILVLHLERHSAGFGIHLGDGGLDALSSFPWASFVPWPLAATTEARHSDTNAIVPRNSRSMRILLSLHPRKGSTNPDPVSGISHANQCQPALWVMAVLLTGQLRKSASHPHASSSAELLGGT